MSKIAKMFILFTFSLQYIYSQEVKYDICFSINSSTEKMNEGNFFFYFERKDCNGLCME